MVEYAKVIRYPNWDLGGQAYAEVQEAIYNGPPNDLSVYRVLTMGNWFVIVIGKSPPASLDVLLSDILKSGEPDKLPQSLMDALMERREQAIKKGPWTERHLR